MRSTPITLTNNEVREMLKKNNFYCKAYLWNQDYANDSGEFKNDFLDNFDGTVTDRSSGLMWQKGNAPDYGRWKEAQPYIARLNAERFAGYTDWRLPTIEELSTLMSRERLNDDLYISPLFSNRMWFWSSDTGGAGAGRDWTGSAFAWAINFDYGSLFCLETSNAQDIRAVRNAVISSNRKFFRNHLSCLLQVDNVKLTCEHYHQDAEIVSGNRILQGHTAIEQYISETSGLIGKILNLSIDAFAEFTDVILFKATVKTEKIGTVSNKGAFYLKDGKIWRQISMSVPVKGDSDGNNR